MTTELENNQPGTEGKKPPEGLSRQDVIDALKTGTTYLKKDAGEETDAEKSKKLNWILKSVEDAYKRVNKTKNKGTFENRFKDNETGKPFRQREGIPVDYLLSFLKQKSTELEEGDAREKINYVIKVIEAHSHPYEEIRPEQNVRALPENEQPIVHARKKQESHLISQDWRATGTKEGDWERAGEELHNRLELILPEPDKPNQEDEGDTDKTDGDDGGDDEGDDDETEPPPTVTPDTYTINIIGHQEAVDKAALLHSRRWFSERQREHAVWKVWRWPRRIWNRIGEGAEQQREFDRMRAIMAQNNNSFLDNPAIAAAAAGIDRSSVVERFKRKDTTEGEQKLAQVTDTDLQTGLKALIREVANANITSEDQMRDRLADFIRNNINNQQVRDFFGANRQNNLFGTVTEYFATDFFETAKRINEDLGRQQEAIKELDKALERVSFNFGEARDMYSTDIRTITERAVAWARRRQNEPLANTLTPGSRIKGAILSPLVVGAATSFGFDGLFRGASWAGKWGGYALGAGTLGAGALAGATVAAGRRYYDIKRDLGEHVAGRTMGEEAPNTPQQSNRFVELFRRVNGTYRRSDLEDFRLETRSADQLLNGDAGINMPSIHDLLNLDLNDPQNQQQLAERHEEIKIRINRSRQYGVDLLTFSSRENSNSELNQLFQTMSKIENQLTQSGLNQQDIEALRTQEAQGINNHIDSDINNKNRGFRNYRLRQAAGAGAFGMIVGAGAGFAAREAVHELGHYFGGGGHGVSSNASSGNGSYERSYASALPELNTDAGFDIDKAKELFTNGGTARIDDNLHINVISSDHSVSLLDNSGKNIPDMPKMTINGEGIIHVDGNIPEDIRTQLTRDKLTINQGLPNIFTQTEVIISANDGSISSTLEGVNTQIPDGTEWVQNTDGTWDLVVESNRTILIANAAVQDGQIVLPTTSHPQADIFTLINKETGLSPLSPEEALSKWEKLGSNVDHSEWYSYNQPGSQGNELGLHTIKNGSTLELHMDHMGQAWQHGLNPEHINVQDVIKEGKGGFAFSLPGHEGKPVWIPDSVDGKADGILRLDINDTSHFVNLPDGSRITLGEFSKMVLNNQVFGQLPNGDIATEVYGHQNVFNIGGNGQMGFIRAGQMVDHDGKNVFQSFATIKGSGDPTAFKPIYTPSITLTHDITETTYKTNPTFDIVPPKPEVTEPPLPEPPPKPLPPAQPDNGYYALPFAPRHPLSPIEKGGREDQKPTTTVAESNPSDNLPEVGQRGEVANRDRQTDLKGIISRATDNSNNNDSNTAAVYVRPEELGRFIQKNYNDQGNSFENLIIDSRPGKGLMMSGQLMHKGTPFIFVAPLTIKEDGQINVDSIEFKPSLNTPDGLNIDLNKILHDTINGINPNTPWKLSGIEKQGASFKLNLKKEGETQTATQTQPAIPTTGTTATETQQPNKRNLINGMPNDYNARFMKFAAPYLLTPGENLNQHLRDFLKANNISYKENELTGLVELRDIRNYLDSMNPEIREQQYG